MTPTISPGLIQSQGTPARIFVLDPIKSIAEFQAARDAAFGLLIGRVQGKGSLPANYDYRPISPADDLTTANYATSANWNPDWSIGSASLSATTGSILSSENTILSGVQPQDRYMVFYGTDVETPGTPVEVGWVFKSGSNIKAVWLLQDILGFEHPRAIARLQPVYGPSDSVAITAAVAAQAPITDVHFTLWAEPLGTTVTAANLRN